ncbi:hypothetical protein Peur_030178 [Populus x canadensis]
MQCRCSKNFQTQSQNRNLNRRSVLDRGITKLSNADLLNFAFGCGQDAVFDFSSVPKLKRFVISANERQLHYVFTRLSKHVPRMRSLTVKTSPGMKENVKRLIENCMNLTIH